MFYYYLATIHACVRLVEKGEVRATTPTVPTELFAPGFQKIENAFRHRASHHLTLRSDPLGIISCSGRSLAGTSVQISDMPERCSTSRLRAVNLAGSVNVVEQPQH